LQSAIYGQTTKNEIIVIVDSYVDESQEILNKHKDNNNIDNKLFLIYYLIIWIINYYQ
jgi:hypothetical protein